MGTNEFYKIDKLIPYKTNARERPYIKDDDLQIHIPHAKETSQTESTSAFKELISHYQPTNNVHVSEQEAIHVAKNELESIYNSYMDTYNSMMEISKQLREASQEFIQMQS